MSELSEEEIIKEINEKLIEPFYCFPNPTSIELKDSDVKLLETLLDLYQKEKEKNKEYKNALVYMVNQFADTDDNPKTKGSTDERLYTEGLSALEEAFSVLDIDEGIKREDLYKLLEERN